MASTYTPIATTTASGSASTITFSSISGSYTDLVIVLNGNATTGSTGSIGITFNSDTGSNYSYTRLLGSGTAASSAQGSGLTTSYIGDTGTDRAVFIVNVQNYSNTTTNKTFISRSSSENYVSSYVGLWRSTSAITSVTIRGPGGANWSSTTTATLYGIKAA